jgi:N6-adenosine-specific RNA methylase IME4
VIELPRVEGGFGVIASDPPWAFKAYAPPAEDAEYRRDTEVHYSTMDLPAIKAMPVADVAAKDCHLFLWTTGPHLPQALEVMTAWGFTYSGIGFTWIKLRRSLNPDLLCVIGDVERELHLGLGHGTRKNSEICLHGRRGSPRRLAKDVREVIISPVREHSRKPEQFFERVERFCAGPRLDMFARSSRPGWTAFGNEVEKFDEQ